MDSEMDYWEAGDYAFEGDEYGIARNRMFIRSAKKDVEDIAAAIREYQSGRDSHYDVNVHPTDVRDYGPHQYKRYVILHAVIPDDVAASRRQRFNIVSIDRARSHLQSLRDRIRNAERRIKQGEREEHRDVLKVDRRYAERAFGGFLGRTGMQKAKRKRMYAERGVAVPMPSLRSVTRDGSETGIETIDSLSRKQDASQYSVVRNIRSIKLQKAKKSSRLEKAIDATGVKKLKF